jgi:DNA-binding transcriptional regulator YiaG
MTGELQTAKQIRYAAELGKHVRDTRRLLGVSQAQLGKVMEAGRVTVSRWETGQSMPTPFQLDLLAKFVAAKAKIVRAR